MHKHIQKPRRLSTAETPAELQQKRKALRMQELLRARVTSAMERAQASTDGPRLLEGARELVQRMSDGDPGRALSSTMAVVAFMESIKTYAELVQAAVDTEASYHVWRTKGKRPRSDVDLTRSVEYNTAYRDSVNNEGNIYVGRGASSLRQESV